MVDVYSPFKAAHHVERILTLRNGGLIYPTQIQVDITNECNHHCRYCFSQFTIGNTSDKIDTTVMLKLLDDARDLDMRSFLYTGGGEPFKHDNIYEILERTIANNLDYAMVTNGSLIDFSREDLLKKMSWIRISLDAVDYKMYRSLRGVDEFDKAIGIVSEFSSRCPDTVLGISFVINPINYPKITEFARMGKKLGVDNVRFSIAWFPSRDGAYPFDEIDTLLDEAKELQTKDFKVFDLTKGRLVNLSLEGKEYTSCGYQHFTTVIGANSNIYPCCTLKYQSEASFGDLKEQSFKDIWTGEKRINWLKRNYLAEVCSNNVCWMEEKNKFIDYLTTKNPKHVNFI